MSWFATHGCCAATQNGNEVAAATDGAAVHIPPVPASGAYSSQQAKVTHHRSTGRHTTSLAHPTLEAIDDVRTQTSTSTARIRSKARARARLPRRAGNAQASSMARASTARRGVGGARRQRRAFQARHGRYIYSMSRQSLVPTSLSLSFPWSALRQTSRSVAGASVAAARSRACVRRGGPGPRDRSGRPAGWVAGCWVPLPAFSLV